MVDLSLGTGTKDLLKIEIAHYASRHQMNRWKTYQKFEAILTHIFPGGNPYKPNGGYVQKNADPRWPILYAFDDCPCISCATMGKTMGKVWPEEQNIITALLAEKEKFANDMKKPLPKKKQILTTVSNEGELPFAFAKKSAYGPQYLTEVKHDSSDDSYYVKVCDKHGMSLLSGFFIPSSKVSSKDFLISGSFDYVPSVLWKSNSYVQFYPDSAAGWAWEALKNYLGHDPYEKPHWADKPVPKNASGGLYTYGMLTLLSATHINSTTWHASSVYGKSMELSGNFVPSTGGEVLFENDKSLAATKATKFHEDSPVGLMYKALCQWIGADSIFGESSKEEKKNVDYLPFVAYSKKGTYYTVTKVEVIEDHISPGEECLLVYYSNDTNGYVSKVRITYNWQHSKGVTGSNWMNHGMKHGGWEGVREAVIGWCFLNDSQNLLQNFNLDTSDYAWDGVGSLKKMQLLSPGEVIAPKSSMLAAYESLNQINTVSFGKMDGSSIITGKTAMASLPEVILQPWSDAPPDREQGRQGAVDLHP